MTRPNEVGIGAIILDGKMSSMVRIKCLTLQKYHYQVRGLQTESAKTCMMSSHELVTLAEDQKEPLNISIPSFETVRALI